MSYPSQCPRCPGAPACHRPAHWQGHHHSQFPLVADGQCRSIPPIQCWMVLHWCSLPKCLMTEAMTSQVHQLMTVSLEYFCKMTKWLYIDIDRFWLHPTVGSFWETPSTQNNVKNLTPSHPLLRILTQEAQSALLTKGFAPRVHDGPILFIQLLILAVSATWL